MKKISWPWGKNGDDKRTINIFLGYFFVVNLCLGTGFLGIPYAFYYSGYVAAIPTLLLTTIISWINANYVLESMSRAQALQYYENSQNPPSSDDTTSSTSTEQFLISDKHPIFEINIDRKFEIAEMCGIFVNKHLRRIYLVLVFILCFMTSWSFSTVAASAWAINIPYHIGTAEQCSEYSFFHNLLPTGGCRYSYYFSLTLFAVIVITICLFDLKEQALVQMVMGLMRFITVTAIVLYCIVKLLQYGDACVDLDISNYTTANTSTLEMFELKGWIVSIPVFVNAMNFHIGIASVTHPVKQKQYLHWLIVAMSVSSTICYMSLGVVVSLWFRASIQETCTLNWVHFTQSGNPTSLRFLSYCLILFPSLDVVSAFPLINHVASNNIYILITGRDSSIHSTHKFDRFLRIVIRVVVATLPILAAFGVANLIFIIKYAGLAGFICYFFPSLLQLRSISVCKDIFGAERKKVEASSILDKSLLSKDLDSKEKHSLYMTPYSIRFLSHPVCVWIVGGIGLGLFILAFISLFIKVNQVTCESAF